VPKAARIAVLINPTNSVSAEATFQDIPEAARALGLQIQVFNASTSRRFSAHLRFHTAKTLSGHSGTQKQAVPTDCFSLVDPALAAGGSDAFDQLRRRESMALICAIAG
jgi:hypothetical protein